MSPILRLRLAAAAFAVFAVTPLRAGKLTYSDRPSWLTDSTSIITLEFSKIGAGVTRGQYDIMFAGTGARCFSGDNGTATLAPIRNPTGVALDSSGNVLYSGYVQSPNPKVSIFDTA